MDNQAQHAYSRSKIEISWWLTWPPPHIAERRDTIFWWFKETF